MFEGFKRVEAWEKDSMAMYRQDGVWFVFQGLIYDDTDGVLVVHQGILPGFEDVVQVPSE